jgi:uncharacterized Tic20 family protein
MKKGLLNLVAFLVLVAGPIVFWISEKGLALRQEGFSWIPFVEAPVIALIMAFIVGGTPKGQVVGQDDQENKLISLFWGVFIMLTVALVGVAFALKADV